MSLAGSALRSRLRALLQLDDSARRIALGLAVGVFIGCTPFWFFQTILAVAVAAVFRLPKLATVTGVWLNLPWFAPFVYAAALKVGTLVLFKRDTAPSEALATLLAGPGAGRWRDAVALLHETTAALLVGTTVVGLAAAALTYVVAFGLITARRGRDAGNGGSGRPRSA